MTIRTTLAGALAVGLGLLAFSLPAAALDATSTTWLNVRSGPGTGHPVVDTLYPDERVTIEECAANGWCEISHDGPDGWVSSTYLEPIPGSGGGGGGGSAEPDCRFELTLGPGGPSLSIVCGDGGGGGVPSPSPSPSGDQVCFFDGANYTGASICYGVGTHMILPAAQNDKLTSVQLHGNAKVRLCEDPNMGPYCRDVTASEPLLGPYLNNKVSSFRIYTGTLPPLKQACFFDGANYTGTHFCTRTGTINVLPAAANNKISSVAVFGGATVRMCDAVNLLPPLCNVFSTNVPLLGAMLNDRVSSLRVY